MAHPFFEADAFPWHRPDAQELHRLLYSTYTTYVAIDALYRNAGSGLLGINDRLRPNEMWSDAIDDLARVHGIRNLCERILDDKQAIALHPAVRAIIAAPDEPEVDTRSIAFARVADEYSRALIASFRLDGSGLAFDGASRHALALSRAYGGARFALARDTLSLADLANPDRPRLVLAGEPGSGKSVALKQWLAAHAREARVPAFLRLAELAEDLGARDPAPADFVRALAERADELGVREADERFFSRALARGDLALALDGFDEVGDREGRERIARAIGALADLPGLHILAASRPAELASTPLPRSTSTPARDFVELATRPFDGIQARDFLRACFDDRDGALWGRIRRNDEVRDLARTPLVLTLLALLAERGPLPESLYEVHEAVVVTAIETWGAQRGHTDALARPALEQLALAILDREVPGAPFPQEDAERLASRATIDGLTRNTGLIATTEKRNKRLGITKLSLQFVHLQLLEHLAGCALAHRLRAGDWSIVDRWDMRSKAGAPYQAAAGSLARSGDEVLIERWAERLLAAVEKADAERLASAAMILGQADADACPAEQLTARILSELDGRLESRDPPVADERDLLSWLLAKAGSLFEGLPAALRLIVLSALAPRPRALRLMREIAMETEDGASWLRARDDASREAAIATCARTCCEVDRENSLDILDRAIARSPEMTAMVTWVPLAASVEQVRGRPAAIAFLRSLASERWLASARPDEVAALLDRIDVNGYRDLARRLALEGLGMDLQRTPGFVDWLEALGDHDTYPELDAYYVRLAQLVERGEGRLSDMRLPLWPARESDAIDRLRRAGLRNNDTAWRILVTAPFDARYADAYRDASRRFFEVDTDRSRVRSWVNFLLEKNPYPMAAELLLDALGHQLSDRWSGKAIVAYLVARGRGAEARARLEASRATVSEAHRGVIDELLKLCA